MISVLYVDDEPGLLELGREYLRMRGDFEVDLLTSATDALEHLQSHTYDVIISDYQMPEMDGLEFLQQVRLRHGPVPFILFTGRGREEVVIRALNLGADFYLQKGGDPMSLFAELAHKVRQAVQRRRADLALEESEHRYRDVVETQTEFISRFLPDGTHVFANEAYCRHFGKHRNEVIGHRFIPAVPDEDRERVLRHFASLTPEQPVAEIEHRVIMPDGSIRWHWWNDHAIFDETGRIIEYQSIGKDITDRKQIEDDLKRSENLYRTIFNTTGTASIIIAPDTTILLANKGWEILTGMPRSEQENKISWTAFFDRDDVERMIQYHYARRKNPALVPDVYDSRLIDANKRVHHCFVYVRMIPGTENSVASLVDITERKLAEEALQRSESRWRQWLENSPVPIALYTLEGKVLFSNRQFERIVGWTIGDIPDLDTWWRSAYPDPQYRAQEKKSWLNRIRTSIDTGAYIEPQETRIVCKDGTTRVLEFSGLVIENEVLVTYYDLTTRKEAEESLRESEERYRLIADNTADCIWIFDMDLNLKYISPSIKNMRGFTVEEALSQPLEQMMTPRSLESVMKRFREEMDLQNAGTADPARRVSFETEEYCKDGSTIIVENSVTLLRDNDHRPIGMLGISRDITRKKKAEEALRESEEKFRALADNAKVAIIVIQDGRIVYVNNHMVCTSGYSREELAERSYLDLIHPDQQVPARKNRHAWLQGARAPFSGEIKYMTKNGETRWAVTSTTEILFEAKPAALVSMVGITRRKKAEEDLQIAYDQLAAANEKLQAQYDALRDAGERIQKSEQDYRSIIENMQDPFFRADMQGNLVMVNPAFVQEFGYAGAEEVLEKNIAETFYHDPDDREKLLRQMERSGRVSKYPVTLRRKDMRLIRARISSLYRYDLHGRPLVIEGIIHLLADPAFAGTSPRHSEEDIRTILDNLPDLVLVHRDGLILYVNPAMRDSMGLRPEEVLQKPILDYVAPEYRARVTEAVRERLKNGRDHPYEIELLRHAGGRRTVIIRGTVIEFDGFPAILNVLTDITERRKAEQALRESEEQFRSLVETSPDIIWEIDLQGNLRYVSPMIRTIMGYTPEEIIGKSILDLVPEAGKSAAVQALTDAISQKGALSPVEIPARHRNGKDMIVEIRSARLTGPDGTVKGFRGISVDITKRRRAEAALRESENKFATVFRSSPVPLTLISLENGTIADTNDAFVRNTGYSREEVIGKKTGDIGNFINGADYERIISSIERDGFVNGREVMFRIKSGMLRTCLYSASTVTLNGRPHILSNIEDISERKQMEEVLRHANQKLSLLYGITRHDINNQLLTLNGFIALLQTKIPDPAYRDYFSRITNASEQIAAMIAFTREYEKIGTGIPIWQDLTAALNAGVKGILPPHITLKNDLFTGIEVFADPMLEKIFFNLLDNAVRHGGRVTEIRISSRRTGENLVVVWEDNGVGIAAENKERIFEQGFGKNTGHGMFLAREILSLTGITIREYGEPGKGARFGITVPMGAFRISEK